MLILLPVAIILLPSGDHLNSLSRQPCGASPRVFADPLTGLIIINFCGEVDDAEVSLSAIINSFPFGDHEFAYISIPPNVFPAGDLYKVRVLFSLKVLLSFGFFQGARPLQVLYSAIP